MACLWVHNPDLGRDLAGDGPNPLPHVLAWVFDTVGGWGWLADGVMMG